jgi:hypothetical protein
MSGVWFGGLARHGYPQQRIFLLDVGYGGHKKKLADKLIHVLWSLSLANKLRTISMLYY